MNKIYGSLTMHMRKPCNQFYVTNNAVSGVCVAEHKSALFESAFLAPVFKRYSFGNIAIFPTCESNRLRRFVLEDGHFGYLRHW